MQTFRLSRLMEASSLSTTYLAICLRSLQNMFLLLCLLVVVHMVLYGMFIFDSSTEYYFYVEFLGCYYASLYFFGVNLFGLVDIVRCWLLRRMRWLLWRRLWTLLIIIWMLRGHFVRLSFCDSWINRMWVIFRYMFVYLQILVCFFLII